VWDLLEKTVEMIRVDLEAAGVPYETESGVADFHALRAAYISNLVASGASVKVCQVLARHSTPSLTIGVYAKASLHDVRGAVSALPDLAPGPANPVCVASPGTDEPISKRLALHLPYAGDGSVRKRSGADGMGAVVAEAGFVQANGPNALNPGDLDAPGRARAGPGGECRRWESNPHEGYPSEDFKSSASAIPPRRRSGYQNARNSDRSTGGEDRVDCRFRIGSAPS